MGIALDQDLLKLVLQQAPLEFMLAHKAKYTDSLLQETAVKLGYYPPSDSHVKVKRGRIGDFRFALPAEIGAEMNAVWLETVAPKTGLASYEALREWLA